MSASAVVDRSALVVIGLVLLAALPVASDHMDSPFLDEPANASIDIGDTFAFSGTDGFVMAMSFNPLTTWNAGVWTGPGAPGPQRDMTLDPSAVYGFRIDTDRDLVPDIAYLLTVANDASSRTQTLTLRRTVAADARSNEAVGEIVLTGESSVGAQVVVNEADGVKLFVGPRQDPFFFDFKGVESRTATALRYALGADNLPSDGTAANTFGPTNVTLVAIEVSGLPQAFSVWGTTSRMGRQLDRAGQSSTTAVFLPACFAKIPWPCHDFSAQKQPYNETTPDRDLAGWGADFRTVMSDLNGDPATIDSFFLPDVLRVDTSRGTTYPNGRGFREDAVYRTLRIINPDMSPGEGERFNPQNLPRAFPYAATPVDAKGQPIGISSDAVDRSAAAPDAQEETAGNDTGGLGWIAALGVAVLLGGAYALSRRRRSP